MGLENIETARNGKEAYEKYKKSLEEGNPFNIITLDIEMPVLDGKSAAKKIRRLESEMDSLNKCLILMISGNCGELEINECLNKEGEIKADAFLKKPVSLEDLKSCILNGITN